MRRAVQSGWPFVGFALALALSLTGLLLPRAEESGADRVVMIGVRGLSWQAVLDLIEKGGLPTLAALIEGEAAIGDIIADGYRGEEQILESIATGRFPSKQPSRTIWEELREQGQEVSVSGFPFGSPQEHIPGGSAAIRLLRDVPDRHMFLYISGIRGERGEPIREGYEALDEMLGLLVAAAGPRTTFLLFSEKGNPGGRVTYRPYFPELHEWPAIGFFLAWGGDVRGSAPPHTVAPVDLAPTLLHVAGARIPNDMDGLVLFKVFDDGFYHKRRLAFRP
jgi:hypothetical protein